MGINYLSFDKFKNFEESGYLYDNIFILTKHHERHKNKKQKDYHGNTR